jgi:hypothetical protein
MKRLTPEFYTAAEEVSNHTYSLGFADDGQAILCDGVPMTPEDVIRALTAYTEMFAGTVRYLKETVR